MSFCLYNFLSVHGGMLEVTKGRTLPPWTRRQLAIHHLRGCAPKISLSSSKLWSNNLLLGARSFVMFKVSMSFYLQENHLVCNAMSFTLCRVWRMIFWSWKWMIQSTWTRISLRENLQWRLMGLFNACDKFLLLRASQPKKRICCRHDHHQLLETSFLILLLFQLFQQKKRWGNLDLPNFTTKTWITEYFCVALWPWKLLPTTQPDPANWELSDCL